MVMKKINRKLPDSFKDLYWYCDYSKIDIDKDVEVVMTQTINYGDWKQWQWVFRYYGIKRAKNIIENIPASSFRSGSLKLVSLILGIKKLKYALRIDRIRAEKSILETQRVS
jgi:hypothetical protein